MSVFADRLAETVRATGTALCVGLDPRWAMLPHSLRERHADHGLDGLADAYAEFCLRVLDLVTPVARVIKPQAAFFELAGPAGMRALSQVLDRARELGCVTILDAKRGDIASTATAYADAAFAGAPTPSGTIPVWNADALTVNPYLGEDAVAPFVQAARSDDRGVFVLVRTSNPGGGLFQNLICEGRPLYRHVGDAVARWNAETLGTCGFGAIGAVVGATHPRELVELRAALPDVWFLVPGYGAQGGTAADVRAAFRSDGLGAIVNSSRGITFPFHPDDPAWEGKIIVAAKLAAEEMRV
ncbi:MAG: orotidine-5'-phosphate decarboxylase [Bacteroidales bacterium]|nr:orotidine-5'-phosphate decarboxylase [Bacteroidales bacterium]